MTKPRHSDAGHGWINKRFAKIEKTIREQNAAKRLQAATIGSGGITVRDGGGILVEDGGDFISRYPDSVGGGEATRFGPLRSMDAAAAGYVLQLLDETGSQVFYAVRNYPTPDFPSGLSAIGGTADQIDYVAKMAVSLYRGDLAGTYSYIALAPDGARVSAPEGVYLDGASNGVMVQHGTTSAAANCFIDPTTGRLWRTTSSDRFKQDATEAPVDVDAALALIPRRFRRKDEVVELGDAAPWYVGFIAEEAAALGLDDWVTCDESGPESFAYSTWGVALQAVARRHQQRINEHQQRINEQQQQIDDLTAQIEDLTARLEALGT